MNVYCYKVFHSEPADVEFFGHAIDCPALLNVTLYSCPVGCEFVMMRFLSKLSADSLALLTRSLESEFGALR